MTSATLGLTGKITLLVLGLVFLLTAGSLSAVALTLRAGLEQTVEQAVAQGERRVRSLIAHRGEILDAAVRPAANAPLLKAALGSAEVDATTLEGVADEQRRTLGADLLLLLGPDGLPRASSPPLRALPPGIVLDRPGVVLVDGKPHLVVAKPIDVQDQRLGYVAAGLRLGTPLLQALREETGTEVLLRVGHEVHGQALVSVPAEQLRALELAGGATRSLEIGDLDLRVRSIALGGGVNVLLVRNLDEEFHRFRTTLLSLLLIGLAAAALGSASAFVFARRLTRPLRWLTDIATRVVSEGDFSQPVPVLNAGEIGSLTRAFSEMMSKFREMLSATRGWAEELGEAAVTLSSSADEQSHWVSQQASALQQTHVTAQEIKQTSVLASQRAQKVLEVTGRAEQVQRAGEQSIESSLAGFSEIRGQVEQIARTILDLRERTHQIGGITQTVKDLADQSNILALNAAIEAVRSGEHGKGFGVVAREIRSLADQSIRATGQVREILDDVAKAIGSTVTIAERGAERMERGLEQVKDSGENMRELSRIMQDSSAAVRQIAAAVSQQDAGITQIFAAITDLSKIMEDTVQKVDSTRQAAARLKGITERVSVLVNSYRI